MIFSETDIEKRLSFLKTGGKYFRCITHKSFPGDVNLLLANGIIGGYGGMVSDKNQFETPFLYSLSIVFQNLKAKIHAKCNLVLQQQAAGSFAPSLKRKLPAQRLESQIICSKPMEADLGPVCSNPPIPSLVRICPTLIPALNM
ncbi:MAG: hypothetical protein M0Z58_09075 [Nitrospiraceae bacterium]|nr:hypothetical protein [Nitrospiraceae bacterium]